MFNSRIGTRIIKIVNTVFANVGYDVRLNSEYWKKKHVTKDTSIYKIPIKLLNFKIEKN